MHGWFMCSHWTWCKTGRVFFSPCFIYLFFLTPITAWLWCWRKYPKSQLYKVKKKSNKTWNAQSLSSSRRPPLKSGWIRGRPPRGVRVLQYTSLSTLYVNMISKAACSHLEAGTTSFVYQVISSHYRERKSLRAFFSHTIAHTHTQWTMNSMALPPSHKIQWVYSTCFTVYSPTPQVQLVFSDMLAGAGNKFTWNSRSNKIKRKQS